MQIFGYMHCIFLGISDKEKHMLQRSQLVYIFGFFRKKEGHDIIPATCLGFLKRKQKKKDKR